MSGSSGLPLMLARVLVRQSSGPDRTSARSLRVQGHRASGLGRTSARWGSAEASGAGRPVPAGRAVAGTFPASLLLLRLLVHLPLLLVLAP